MEEIKKANIEQFIVNLRNELNEIWDKCFYSENQKNQFKAFHSIDFTEELLEKHEAELDRMKDYLELNKELFVKVERRQEIWSKFMELERRAKDPTRLINARGTALLEEERERNKVNKTLPRVEQELHELIQNWEQEHGRDFRVRGVSFAAFIEQQKEEHLRGLEMEKIAREKAKKENLLHETRFGAKPSTPAKLKCKLYLEVLIFTRTHNLQPFSIQHHEDSEEADHAQRQHEPPGEAGVQRHSHHEVAQGRKDRQGNQSKIGRSGRKQGMFSFYLLTLLHLVL